MFEGELLGVFALTWQAAVMLGLGGLLIYLGIAKQVEPVLLVPIGMGVILANVPPGHGRRAILRRHELLGHFAGAADALLRRRQPSHSLPVE